MNSRVLLRSYRPPSQDGPSASNHNTEVLSVTRLMVLCKFSIRLTFPSLLVSRIVDEEMALVLSWEPINDEYKITEY